MSNTVGPEDKNESIDRRSMLKKSAAGAAAAGLVWSAPKVQGLSLRPNYASAASGAVGPATQTVGLGANAVGQTNSVTGALGNGSWTVAFNQVDTTGVSGAFTFNGGPLSTVDAPSVSTSPAGAIESELILDADSFLFNHNGLPFTLIFNVDCT